MNLSNPSFPWSARRRSALVLIPVLAWCAVHSGGLAETTAKAPAALVNVDLAADAPPERVVLEGWFSCNVGNAPTARSRAAIDLFRLAADNLAPGADGQPQWSTSNFAEQALKYARTGLWIFRRSQITPENLLSHAEEIVKRAGKGADEFWNLKKHATSRITVDAPPGEQRTRVVTGYTRRDLNKLMEKQAEAAGAFVKAVAQAKKGETQ